MKAKHTGYGLHDNARSIAARQLKTLKLTECPVGPRTAAAQAAERAASRYFRTQKLPLAA